MISSFDTKLVNRQVAERIRTTRGDLREGAPLPNTMVDGKRRAG
jgi:hypothetical protein